MRHGTLGLCAALVLVAAAASHAAPLGIVRGGRSAYSIYYSPKAPEAVHRAASELQRVVEASTGARMAIVKEPVRSPMIVLGDTPRTRDAGLKPGSLPYENFRIVTKPPHLYIFGHDTPDGKPRWRGRFSRGTLFGANAFLERFVGVRWLLPGPWGEDIPKRRDLRVPPTDTLDKPRFAYRRLNYVGERREQRPEVMDQVKEWKVRSRVDLLHTVGWGHSFDDHPHISVIRKHPEYMAKRLDGTPYPVPSGKPYKVYPTFKYCLTNPGLIEAFAQSICNRLRERSQNLCDSMTPTDGGNWCMCDNCRKLYMTDDGGRWNKFGGKRMQVTPCVLQFYNRVARIVGKEFPDRLVGGAAYGGYLYPPPKVVRMESNILIGVAIHTGYGFKFYRPATAAQFTRLLEAWSKSGKKLGYSDYSTWMRNWFGAPVPPGRPLLKLLFSRLAPSTVVALNWTGTRAWGYGGLHNYLAARLMWDPKADVDKLSREFLDRAYGPDAAVQVGKIYDILEESLRSYIVNNPKADHEVTYDVIRQVHAPHFARLEALYAAALKRTRTEAQRRRLEMLGDNFVMAHYNMRRAGLAPDPKRSPFYRSDKAYRRFLRETSGGLNIPPLLTMMKRSRKKEVPTLFAPETRTVTIPYLGKDAPPPKIDGDLNDPAWAKASVTGGFRKVGTRSPVKDQTRVRFLFTDDALYLGVEALESKMAELRAACTKRDGTALFADDTIEVFFGHKRRYQDTYWQLALNPLNTVYDGVAGEAEYKLKFRSATSRKKDRWIVEIEIPFKSLRLRRPPFGQTWRANICRGRRAGKRAVSAWSSVESRFHEPNSFGTWRFGEK